MTAKPNSVTTSSNPVEQLRLDHENGVDIWEAAVSIGIQWTDDQDEMRWRKAALAVLIGTVYGQNRFGGFASEINESIKTLRELRQVYGYFGESAILEWRRNPILRYTHFRLAMRVGENHEDIRRAFAFLKDCVENDWRVGKAEIEADRQMGKVVNPRKIAEVETPIIEVEGEFVTVQITNEEALAEFRAMMKDSRPVTLKVFEVGKEEESEESDEPEAELSETA